MNDDGDEHDVNGSRLASEVVAFVVIVVVIVMVAEVLFTRPSPSLGPRLAPGKSWWSPDRLSVTGCQCGLGQRGFPT